MDKKKGKIIVYAHGAKSLAKRIGLMAMLSGMGAAQAGGPQVQVLHADCDLACSQARPQLVSSSVRDFFRDVTDGILWDARRQAERMTERAITGAIEGAIGQTAMPFARRYDQELEEAKRAIDPRDLERFLGEERATETRRAAAELARHLFVVARHQGDPRYFSEASTRMEIHLGHPSAALLHLKLAHERGEVAWPAPEDTPRQVSLWVYRNLRRLDVQGYLDLTGRLSRMTEQAERLIGEEADADSWLKAARAVHNAGEGPTLDHLAWLAALRASSFAPDMATLAAHSQNVQWTAPEGSPGEMAMDEDLAASPPMYIF